MNTNQVKEMMAPIVSTLDLSGCFPQIVPRATLAHIEQFLAAKGELHPNVASFIACNILEHMTAVDEFASVLGELVATVRHSDALAWVLRSENALRFPTPILMSIATRLAANDAAWVLVTSEIAPSLPTEVRNALLKTVVSDQAEMMQVVEESGEVTPELFNRLLGRGRK